MLPLRICVMAGLGLVLASCAPPERPGSLDNDKPATAGTLIGSFIGRDIGASLDRGDIDDARRAQKRAYAAPIGQSIPWNNQASGHSGTITPQRDGNDTDGNYCREYRSTVTVDGKTDEADGAACRRPDGGWSVINN